MNEQNTNVSAKRSEPAGQGTLPFVRAQAPACPTAKRSEQSEPAGGRLAFVRASDRKRGGRAAPPQKEGAALLIVMFVLLTTTATAMFAIHATAFEIRAAGHARQAMQTQYVAETGLTASMALVDSMGASAILHAMQNSNAPAMEPFEPELFEGKRGYRLYLEDFGTLSNAPITRESLGGSTQVYEPLFIVDLNDHYTYTGSIAGHRSDGYGRLQYMHATYTSRGRTRLAGGDQIGSVEGDREYHEGASDARAYGLSGPFGR